MKNYEEAPFIKETSPIQQREDEYRDADVYEESVSACGCGCFRFCCFGLPQQRSATGGEERETWLKKHLKKLREVSELVAGPKWKNLIRKIGRYCNHNSRKSRTLFQYDPQSYALNFERVEEGEEEELKSFPAPSFIDHQRRAGL